MQEDQSQFTRFVNKKTTFFLLEKCWDYVRQHQLDNRNYFGKPSREKVIRERASKGDKKVFGSTMLRYLQTRYSVCLLWTAPGWNLLGWVGLPKCEESVVLRATFCRNFPCYEFIDVPRTVNIG